MSKALTIQFKRGDDFKIDLTFTDTANDIAVAARASLDAAQEAYDMSLEADPQVPVDIAAFLAARDAAQLAYDNAIVVDITGWVITAQARMSDKLINNLTVNVPDPLTGAFTVMCASSLTTDWPVTKLDVDIQVTDSSFGTVSTETFYVEVQRDVTQ